MSFARIEKAIKAIEKTDKIYRRWQAYIYINYLLWLNGIHRRRLDNISIHQHEKMFTRQNKKKKECDNDVLWKWFLISFSWIPRLLLILFSALPINCYNLAIGSLLFFFFLVFLEYTICRVSHCLVDSANIVVLPLCRIWSNRGKRLLKCTAIEYYDDRGTFSSTICLNLGAGVSVGWIIYTFHPINSHCSYGTN